MRSFAILAATSLFAAAQVNAAAPPSQTTGQGVQQPSSTPQANVAVVQGCWGSAGELVKIESVEFNSRDKCGITVCASRNYTVGASYRGKECWCGNKYPPKADVVKDSECNVVCEGYGYDACGGAKAWTVYNTGIDPFDVQFSSDTSSTSSAPASAQQTSVPSPPSSTSSTPSQSETSPPAPPSSSSNTVGIAVGVVVGLVALVGIGLGIYWFLRHKRNQEIEEEHRRTAAVNSFIHGEKPPGSSGGASTTDSRMDPVMAQRRMSDGSIADNQDYSRRILRVTNA